MSEMPSGHAPSDDRRRCEVYYLGRVQGVGFRFTVRSIAARLAVTGFVRNLADGRVQLVAEGSAAEIRRLLDGVSAEFGRHIVDAQVSYGPASGRFAGFDIRF